MDNIPTHDEYKNLLMVIRSAVKDRKLVELHKLAHEKFHFIYQPCWKSGIWTGTKCKECIFSGRELQDCLGQAGK